MSDLDAWQAQIEAELGAPLRTFRTVKGALLWYAEVNAGPAKMISIPLEQGSGPRSQNSRDTRNATHAAIMLCLRGVAHADLLVEWTRSWRSREDMAQDEGFPSGSSLRLTMRHTEAVLRSRMEARGLLRKEKKR